MTEKAPILQFDAGDPVAGQKFLANLQAGAVLLSDANTWAVTGAEHSYTPGNGHVLIVPTPNISIPARLPFPAKITSTSGAACAWTALAPATLSTWANSTGDSPLTGTTSTNPAYEINGRQGFPANYQVLMWQEQANNGDRTFWFVAPNSNFTVKIEKDGGVDGTVSAAATYTYTVRTLPWNGSSGGAVLGTTVALATPRSFGAVVFQTGSVGYGEVTYDGSTLKLLNAYEVPRTFDCDNP